jgi:hypothetical protein
MKKPETATTLGLATSGYHAALVVKTLLDIIHTSEPTGCQSIELAFQVITLATEWECEAVLKILKKDLTIQALINNTQGPSNDHLRLAYKLGDHHLMALIAQRDRSPGSEFVLSKVTKWTRPAYTSNTIERPQGLSGAVPVSNRLSLKSEVSATPSS